MKTLEPLRFTDGNNVPAPLLVQDISLLEEMPESVSVRSAKANLSRFLELVASGHEIVITSDGKPKARLAPVSQKRERQAFQFSKGYEPAPLRVGPTSEEIIREDRDSRGW